MKAAGAAVSRLPSFGSKATSITKEAS